MKRIFETQALSSSGGTKKEFRLIRFHLRSGGFSHTLFLKKFSTQKNAVTHFFTMLSTIILLGGDT
ncbi:hypothetical protein EPICR_10044 [Candidatus Desulfarcum epimagneticum]|uniref:Uncharacterized protein n=1 Tax=uncultured Desulfobacteraceae bacterium TaxID=218296 RepID=A0A484HDE4_9BACT|nr:hypothetical protein EPICR_10044 [uncultured Desulfobacteraceae bacterium]